MKSRNVIRSSRPIKGLVAFVTTLLATGTRGSLGAFGVAMHPVYPTSEHLLAQDEEPVHPGEGSA